MSETLSYAMSAQIPGGPKLAASGSLQVEAYDKVQVVVANDDEDKIVNVQPEGAGLASFLAVSASAYDEQLSYKVNEDTADAITLDGPQMFVGAGAVALLDPEPTTLLFTNKSGGDVTITILVGRDATP